MINLHEGQVIGIPCRVFPGAFNHEAMVIIETKNGEVSGFVRRSDLTDVEDGQGYVRAQIVEVSTDTVNVHLRGSFFTTTGLAQFTPEWAKSNVEFVAA